MSAMIAPEVPALAVAARCRVLEWPRASYYRAPHETVEADMTLRSLIQQVALAWPCYGYRRITAELNRRGHRVNRKRVLRLMRADNLLVLRKRRFVHTTNSDHRLPVYRNLVPELVVTGCDQLWVADITYIRLGREFIYLSVILDAFSRRCIGWALERHLEAELALSALRMALRVSHRNSRVGASLGSGRAICFRRLHGLAQRARCPHQHVAARQRLRQRAGGELHEDAQVRRSLVARVRDDGRSTNFDQPFSRSSL